MIGTDSFAEQVEHMRRDFDYELCYECGKDFDRHEVQVILPLGLPFLRCLDD